MSPVKEKLQRGVDFELRRIGLANQPPEEFRALQTGRVLGFREAGIRFGGHGHYPALLKIWKRSSRNSGFGMSFARPGT